MRPVVVRVEIDRPAAEVFAFLEDIENNTRWLRGMVSCRWTTQPPVRVGSRYEQVARFLGKEIRTGFEVTDLEPGRLATIRSLPGSSFPLTVRREVESTGAGRCRVTETVHSDPKGFYRLSGSVLRLLVGRNIRRDYQRLKRLLEERGPAG
jgi:uncharacterized membrane protein